MTLEILHLICRKNEKDSTAVPSLITCLIFLLSLLTLPMAARSAEPDLRQLVGEAGHILLLRHALAPGTGDPPHFRLEDCSTQRSLSLEGKEQAARIGIRLRTAGLANSMVFSSQWCRCLETARGLAVGLVSELPALNSFFQSPEQERERTQALRAWIASADLSRPIVLVTHQVNITALTGIVPAQGEIVILGREPSKLRVVARFPDQ